MALLALLHRIAESERGARRHRRHPAVDTLGLSELTYDVFVASPHINGEQELGSGRQKGRVHTRHERRRVKATELWDGKPIEHLPIA